MEMDKLFVPRIDMDLTVFGYAALQKQMEELPWQQLSHANWSEQFPYKPDVRFQLAHAGDVLFVHYVVREDFIKATYVRPNEAVWEDSCVELFLSFDGRSTYYNLEFNVLGTGLIGYGPEAKSERARLSAEQIESVQTVTSVINSGKEKCWATVWCVPVDVFVESGIDTFSGRKAHGNFYKCGDKLPGPHFLSWSRVDFPTPNFHLPAFFGELIFA
ncbi:cellulose/xylan binding protein with CBM9 domain [Sphingobacterium allocomposti]|jgi:hypothetical protein|uniref:Cellulose/xylan binding protein with CBM9 domain n=2 Tax=Sphingobacterium allocomposti TaxID=415956 RepID=A0A5S5DAD2_9SPHI|nr:cellulose/xylan binding protein with CBM9 domain [Sphingobacterium composti Yoo et al. 2007 non Ten et al. 2007]